MAFEVPFNEPGGLLLLTNMLLTPAAAQGRAG